MKCIKYRVTIKHDNETFKLVLVASSEASAISRIMRFDRCPRRSIIKIEYIGEII